MALKLGQNKSCFLTQFAIVAGATKEGYGVKLDSTIFRVALAGLDSMVIGVITDSNIYAINDQINIATDAGDIVQFMAGASGFGIGDNLTSDASGTFNTSTTGQYSFGIALQAATVGQLGWGLISPAPYVAHS